MTTGMICTTNNHNIINISNTINSNNIIITTIPLHLSIIVALVVAKLLHTSITTATITIATIIDIHPMTLHLQHP